MLNAERRERVWLETIHKVTIPAFFIDRGAPITVLFSHGNAEDLGAFVHPSLSVAHALSHSPTLSPSNSNPPRPEYAGLLPRSRHDLRLVQVVFCRVEGQCKYSASIRAGDRRGSHGGSFVIVYSGHGLRLHGLRKEQGYHAARHSYHAVRGQSLQRYSGGVHLPPSKAKHPGSPGTFSSLRTGAFILSPSSRAAATLLATPCPRLCSTGDHWAAALLAIWPRSFPRRARRARE